MTRRAFSPVSALCSTRGLAHRSHVTADMRAASSMTSRKASNTSVFKSLMGAQ